GGTWGQSEAIFPRDGQGDPGGARHPTDADEPLATLAATERTHHMRALQPPAVAMWLLTRLAFGERGESLIGDLVEEYQRRQSRVWFWKQVLVAIGVEAGRDIRAHKLLALRGIVTGFGALSLVSWLLTRVALGVLAKAIPPSWWSYQGGYPRPVELVAAFLMCVAVFSSGWLVARLHRANLAGTLL